MKIDFLNSSLFFRFLRDESANGIQVSGNTIDLAIFAKGFTELWILFQNVFHFVIRKLRHQPHRMWICSLKLLNKISFEGFKIRFFFENKKTLQNFANPGQRRASVQTFFRDKSRLIYPNPFGNFSVAWKT